MGHLLGMSYDGKLHDLDQRCSRLMVNATLPYHPYVGLTHTAPPNPHGPLDWHPIPNDAHEALNHVFDIRLPPTEDRIRAVKTIKQVLALRTELGDNLDLATFSRLSFEALLANEATFHSIHSFLRNPAVNVAEARNFATFFAHPIAAKISPEAYDILMETLQLAIKVGCVLQSEVVTIVRSLKELVHQIFQFSPLRDRQNKLLEAYRVTWEGLRACRLTTISPTVVFGLLNEITLLRALPESKNLKLELCRYVWPVSQTRETNLDEDLAEWARLAHLGTLDAHPNFPRQMDRATLLDILEILPSEDRLRTVISTTRHLTERCMKVADASGEWKDTLVFWLSCLQGSEPFKRNFSHHGTLLHSSLDNENKLPVPLTVGWQEIYRLLSARLPETELADHFKQLPAPETCRILLKFWIPRFFNRANSTAGKQPFEQSEVYTRLTALDVNNVFEKKLAESASKSEDLHSLSFAAVLFALRRSGLNHRSYAERILDLVFKMYGPTDLLSTMRGCLKLRLPLPMRPLETIIKSLAEDQPRLAYSIWRCRRIRVSHFPQLLISLINGSWAHSAQIFQMLQFKEPANTVPVEKRLVPKNTLDQSRNDLVHLVALAFANSRSESTRGAFRNVELCYRYLVNRGSPLQPAMARALVRAGMIRPLENNEHINFGRCMWILGIVRALEGDEVADQLNTVIWRWRANIRNSLPIGPRIGKEPLREWVPVANRTNLPKEFRQASAIERKGKENEQKTGTESSEAGWRKQNDGGEHFQCPSKAVDKDLAQGDR